MQVISSCRLHQCFTPSRKAVALNIDHDV
jgi:hypothetical protein